MAQIAILAVMAVAALNEGAQKRKLLNAEADALHDAANRRGATATADMAEEQRLKEHMEGRALAVAANSGAGVDDPTMVKLIGDLNAEGTYRVMSTLWVGMDEVTGIRDQEMAKRAEGEAALNAGYVKAATTVMSQYGNFGEMWAGAKQDWGKVKDFGKGAWDKMPWSHASKSAKASLGMMDPGVGGTYGGYV